MQMQNPVNDSQHLLSTLPLPKKRGRKRKGVPGPGEDPAPAPAPPRQLQQSSSQVGNLPPLAYGAVGRVAQQQWKERLISYTQQRGSAAVPIPPHPPFLRVQPAVEQMGQMAGGGGLQPHQHNMQYQQQHQQLVAHPPPAGADPYALSSSSSMYSSSTALQQQQQSTGDHLGMMQPEQQQNPSSLVFLQGARRVGPSTGQQRIIVGVEAQGAQPLVHTAVDNGRRQSPQQQQEYGHQQNIKQQWMHQQAQRMFTPNPMTRPPSMPMLLAESGNQDRLLQPPPFKRRQNQPAAAVQHQQQTSATAPSPPPSFVVDQTTDPDSELVMTMAEPPSYPQAHQSLVRQMEKPWLNHPAAGHGLAPLVQPTNQQQHQGHRQQPQQAMMTHPTAPQHQRQRPIGENERDGVGNLVINYQFFYMYIYRFSHSYYIITYLIMPIFV
jgi:hypothetical protein